MPFPVVRVRTNRTWKANKKQNKTIKQNGIITENDTTEANIADKDLVVNANSGTKVNILDATKNANSDITLDFLKEKVTEEESEDDVEPDLMSVNIIESRDVDLSEPAAENNEKLNKDSSKDSSNEL